MALSRETVEAWAVHFLANGQGEWPIPKDNPLAQDGYDFVIVSWIIEDSTAVNLYVRRAGGTVHEFNYKVDRR